MLGHRRIGFLITVFLDGVIPAPHLLVRRFGDSGGFRRSRASIPFDPSCSTSNYP